MLILILISARLWWARGNFIKIVKFLVFLEGSHNMISGSLRFINSEALFEKNPDLTNNLRKLIERQYYSEDWYLILMLNKFHQSHCFNFCMCMIFLAVKIFISLFIKMKYVHFWNTCLNWPYQLMVCTYIMHLIICLIIFIVFCVINVTRLKKSLQLFLLNY